ncbi:FemAB family XrtA/PEP-CTERM system-associated protein [Porticoccus sp. GXU_MW_L64]
MEIKILLTDIHAAIIKHWGCMSACASSKAILDLHDMIIVGRRQIKSLKQDKQKISKRFRGENLSKLEQANLKQAMQHISTKLKAAESSLKHQETTLLAHFLPKRSVTAPVPDRFTDYLSNTVNSKITISPATTAHREQWDDFVQNHTNASIYHLYEWRAVIERTFGHQSDYLIASDSNGRCCGVLPFTLLKSRLFGNFAVSLPYFNYGGPLAENSSIARKLLDIASERCQSAGLEHLEVRTNQLLNGWPQRNEKVSMILRLPDSQGLLDKQLGSKLRAQVNLATKNKLECEIGGTELLADFYSVLTENMRDLGTPVYSSRFFHEILRQFSEQSSIAIVYNGQKPVSCAFLIGFKDMLEIPWASTLRKYNYLNANMYLYRQVLGQAIDQGYRYFDFGRSSKNTSTYRFKKQWGAVPIQHHWHYWLHAGQKLPQLNPNNPKYQLAIKVWQKLPVWLTRIIGPKLVKSLP